jgi:hypothetical protein
MGLTYIDVRRAGPQEEIDGEENGAASLLIGSTTRGHHGPDYLEILGGLEHCAKIAPRTVADAERWIRWLTNWIQAQEDKPKTSDFPIGHW